MHHSIADVNGSPVQVRLHNCAANVSKRRKQLPTKLPQVALTLMAALT